MNAGMRLEALSFSRQGKTILSGIDLQIEKGEILGLIGPNGAGKTTLIKLMIGQLSPDAGKITLDGKALADWEHKERAQRLAYLPQGPVVDSPFTCRELVLMGRYPHLTRFEAMRAKDTAIAREAMRLTETDGLADRLITELSGGELQRVLLARALTQEASLLFLDEPTANLDPHYQLSLLDLVSTLVKDEVGVVMAIHDLNLAARSCDRLALLQAGKIVALGPPETVLTLENLRRVYGIEAEVAVHPATGKIRIAPIGLSSAKPRFQESAQAHA